MDHGTKTFQPVIQFEMADRLIKLQEIQLQINVAQHCSAFVFPLPNFLGRKFRSYI